MNPSIKQLRAFVVAAQSATFAEASERIHLSAPALSVAIRTLEEQVGGALFDRTTRHLALTPEGRSFLPVAMRLLHDWTEAFEDLNERFLKKRGKVTVAALPTLAAGALPGVIAAFRSRFPQINLSIHDVLADDVMDMVRTGRADVGLSVAPAETDDIRFEPVLCDYYAVVCPLGHPLLAAEAVRWRDLSAYPFISLSRSSSVGKDIAQVMRQTGVELDVLCDVRQIGTVSRMVAAGIGVGVLPTLSCTQVCTDGTDYRPLVEPVIPRRLGIVLRRRQPLSAAAAALLEVVREIMPLQSPSAPAAKLAGSLPQI
jgi:LysR family carnitine catabolism transcriptional activator